MKSFIELREELNEVNFKQDHKKNHLSSTKIKNTDIMYHAEKPGSKKIRVFVKPKSAKETEELGVFKDMATAKKSAEQFVKLMGEDLDEGISLWKEFRIKAEDSIIKEDDSLNEEEIHYRVKNMVKPERDRFIQAGKMMKLKVSFTVKGKESIIVMSGTKKNLRDFDSVARGKSSYGDPSSIKHFDEDNLDEFGSKNMSAADKANLRRRIKDKQKKR
ncbi:hypothetical protein N9159_00295 [bacterium]|jgi:hypothetical protein|nr:hypothetical protein [bacterium]|tara:strand:- start:470 stop:1120 length:651 start_codon:yes stop_codon:yes gene_type:complete